MLSSFGRRPFAFSCRSLKALQPFSSLLGFEGLGFLGFGLLGVG